MTKLQDFYGPNAGYVFDLYDRFLQDPHSVDAETQALFAGWTPEAIAPAEPNAPAAPASAAAPVGTLGVDQIVGAARVARMVRELGHLTAHIDPLGSMPPGDPGLELETHGVTTQDLAALPASVIGGPLAEGAQNALEALGRLRQAYSGPIGYEDDQIQVAEERQWLVQAIESRRFFDGFGPAQKREVLERLTEVEGFERFIDKAFGKVKRFGIEGTDMLVPILDSVIHEAAQVGTQEVVMGMAHRGRLNVLAHILGKPYAAILEGFQHVKPDDVNAVSGGGTDGYSGDVKYHLGARRTYTEDGMRDMPITLTPNPSHLEFVNPVVTGRARAAQDDRTHAGAPRHNPKASLAIQIHGDAAFPGQGIVAETLNMSALPGYTVGGSIHIIVNNQIGFTTLPEASRSTLYASDLAKGFEIPIVHVNADDPTACIAAARMAHAYRDRFGKDFLIDLIGYRRSGHNEGDEPAFTQPRLYEAIAAHPTVRALWAKQLEQEGIVTRDEAEAMAARVQEKLEKARTAQPSFAGQKGKDALAVPLFGEPLKTGVPAERLRRLNESLLVRPDGFTPNSKVERILARRRPALDEAQGIDWGHAEALAFASILEDGKPIRLSGQDSQRATFGSRHSVLHDVATGQTYTPLQALPQARASFGVYNSPLSENAVLGFEYGYSIHAVRALVLWEAQFGDFANGAQVIVDQFLVSGNAKWQQTPSLVLLLPHGSEGQGPEHSSARLERYLQLAANNNVRIVNCTTAAQYFHVLRRQTALLETMPRPLIIMTPKSLLRNPRAGSSLQDLSEGAFQPVLHTPLDREAAAKVTRLVLCSGKVGVDLAASKGIETAERVAVARVEELYPFPEAELSAVLAQYPNVRELAWLQEEPRNMGAWKFMSSRLRALVTPSVEVMYVGRPEAASPAEGSGARFEAEQSRVLSAVLAGVPALPAQSKNGKRNGSGETQSAEHVEQRSGATHAR